MSRYRTPVPPRAVRAAGGLVTNGDDRIAVIHRRGRGDWSFPKGHLEPGETHRRAAVREVFEETGFECTILRRLGNTNYTDRYGRPKRVRYYAMSARTLDFVANDEADELRWIGYAELDLLSYECDAQLARRHWTAIIEPL